MIRTKVVVDAGGGAMVQMYIHICPFVYTFVFWAKNRPPPLKWYFCTKKLAKSLIFFKTFWKNLKSSSNKTEKL